MKKSAFLFLLLIFCVSLPLSTVQAEINTYNVKIGEFSKIKVVNDIEVRYVCNPDSAGVAVYTCTDNYADAILFTNKGGTLKISLNTDYTHLSDYLPRITVYSSYLISAENQSKYELEICNLPPSGELSFKQVGNGSISATNLQATKVKGTIATGRGVITLTGETDFATFDMIGTGQILAGDLKAKQVTCNVLGTGSIGCWPIDKLSVKGLASTTVYYKGHPTEIKKSGFAKIEQMP